MKTIIASIIISIGITLSGGVYSISKVGTSTTYIKLNIITGHIMLIDVKDMEIPSFSDFTPDK